MARPRKLAGLSRRERQILEILYRLGEATAAQLRDALPDPPSDSAVRTHLRILEEKGHVQHGQDGPRYIYRPTVSRESMGRTALGGVLANFFAGKGEEMVAALLDLKDGELDDEELRRMARMIERARKEGR